MLEKANGTADTIPIPGANRSAHGPEFDQTGMKSWFASARLPPRNPDAITVSAKTGAGLADLQEAVYGAVRGQQVDVTLEADVTNGRLISFIESHARVHDRQFLDGKVQMKAVMGKRTLADLSRNEQVAVKTVDSLK